MRDRFALLSVLLTGLTCGALSACSAPSSEQGAGNDESGLQEHFALAAAGDVAIAQSDAAERFNWQMNCQGCHHPNGEGNEARGIPPLEKLEGFQKISEGREFLIRVPGMARSALSDEELTQLANWMMDEFSTPGTEPDWPSYSVEEVAELRKRPITDGIVEQRAALLARIASRSE